MSIRKAWGAFARPGAQATASRAGQVDLEQGKGGAPARCAMINAMGSANSPAGSLYDRIGRTYSGQRTTDPPIAARIWSALGEARTVSALARGHRSCGAWRERNAELLELKEAELGARLLVAP